MKLRQAALNLLARREHSRLELRRKLQRYACAPELLEQVLSDLVADNLLSETRFVESFIRSRCARGYGPRRIEYDLNERGIDKATVQHYLQTETIPWDEYLRERWQKQFGEQKPENLTVKAKQTRYLQNRGFTLTQIKDFFATL